MSMALKDENGKNIPAKDEVCFTAHYDDNGKLTEVSSPQPVKFIGDGPDAVGYIERDGKVYTLPVTREKYQEMMQEVGKNQGMGVDLSKKVEVSQDKINTKGVEGVEKEKEKEKEPPKKFETIKVERQNIEAKEQKTKPLAKPLQAVKINPTESTKGVLVQNPVELVKEKQQEKELKKSELTKAKVEPQKTPVIDLNKFVPSKDPKKDLEQIDKALAGKKPEEVSKMLKEQVGRGNSEVVGLIVEATKPSREGGPKETPKLEQKHFLDAYKGGMQSAPIGNKMQKAHETCSKLVKEAGVSTEFHVNKVKENVGKHNVLEQRKGR